MYFRVKKFKLMDCIFAYLFYYFVIISFNVYYVNIKKTI